MSHTGPRKGLPVNMLRTAGAVLLTSCALALAACAGQGPAPQDATPAASATAGTTVLTDAVAAARQAGSARITGSITTTTDGSTATATLSGVQQSDPAAMDLTVRSDAFGAGQVVRELLVDGKAYVQLPELGQRWLSLETAQFAGTVSPLLSGTDLSDLPPFRPAGTGTVEGSAATFYDADIDLGQALRLAGLPAEAVGDTADRLAPEAGSAQVTIAVDEAGRLVAWRVKSTVNLADGSSMTSTADLRFYDFGVATEITAPAPDQVVDAGSLNGPQR